MRLNLRHIKSGPQAAAYGVGHAVFTAFAQRKHRCVQAEVPWGGSAWRRPPPKGLT